MSTFCYATHGKESGFAKKVGDRVMFMDEGKIVESDTPANFLAHPKMTARNPSLGKFLLKKM